MERQILSDNLELNSGENFLILDCVKSDMSFSFKKDSFLDILCTNLKDGISINFTCEENCSIRLSFLNKNNINNVKISANLGHNSFIDAYFADFSSGKSNVEIVFNLNGEYSKINWHLSCLSAKDENKRFDVSVFHNAKNTFAVMDNYGVCKDNAKLVFSGISHIIKGASGSKTHQNAKIMVFDENSDAVAKPILKIDENDIEASHAAIVGKINDEHLFYLTSRGLSESTAKELITFGYLKPIVNGFKEEVIKNEINTLIEGKM